MKHQTGVKSEKHREDWETPIAIIEACQEHFNAGKPFDVDLCASKDNKRFERWFGLDSPEDNVCVALTKWAHTWTTGWCNPPFSIEFMELLTSYILEWQQRYDHKVNRGIFLVLPATKSDQQWWHDLVFQPGLVFGIIHIRGRVYYELNGERKWGADHPTQIMILMQESQAWMLEGIRHYSMERVPLDDPDKKGWTYRITKEC
jgi:hypothetical protein